MNENFKKLKLSLETWVLVVIIIAGVISTYAIWGRDTIQNKVDIKALSGVVTKHSLFIEGTKKDLEYMKKAIERIERFIRNRK